MTNTNNCDIILTGWDELSKKRLNEMSRVVSKVIRIVDMQTNDFMLDHASTWTQLNVRICTKYKYCDNCPFDTVRCNSETSSPLPIALVLCKAIANGLITLKEVRYLAEYEIEKRKSTNVLA